MKRQHSLFAIVLIFMLSPMTANAEPITFTFDMPAFNYASHPSQITTSVLEVTVDNLGTSALNQAFLNTQITGLSTDLTGPVSPLSYYGSAIFITTDAQGVATLDPGQYSGAQVYYQLPANNLPHVYIGYGTSPYRVYLSATDKRWFQTRHPLNPPHIPFWSPVTSRPFQGPDTDEDGIPDDVDNCPDDSNNNQLDWDGDFLGDVCDTDDDNDTILDDLDSCPLTELDAVTDATGCSIAQLCPADDDWKNHGAYVRCVARSSENFLDAGLITEDEKDAIVSEAGQSDIGKKRK